MTAPAVLAVGTVSLDTIESGAKSAKDVLGGSAPYFGAAARVSCAVELLGVVGEDFPQGHLDRLRDAGIGTDGIERHPGETFKWQVRYARDGSRETLGTNRETALRAAPGLDTGPEGAFFGQHRPLDPGSGLGFSRNAGLCGLRHHEPLDSGPALRL